MDKGFLDAALAHAHGLYFGSSKSDTGFKSLFKKIIVIDFLLLAINFFGCFAIPAPSFCSVNSVYMIFLQNAINCCFYFENFKNSINFRQNLQV